MRTPSFFKFLSILLLAVVMPGVLPHESTAFVSPHSLPDYEKGISCLEQYRGDSRHLTEAFKYFKRLVEKFPESPLGYLGLSRLTVIQAYRFDDYYQMDKIRDEAFPLAVRALELGPLMPGVHVQYSFLEDIFMKHRQEQELAQKYLRLLPEEPETFYLLGLYLLGQDDYEKGVEFFQTALTLDPDQTLAAMINKRLGFIYLEHFDQPEKAVAYYQKALDLVERDPALQEHLGRAYLEDGRYNLAIEQFRESLHPAANSMTEYYLLLARGLQCQEAGKTKEAIIYLEKASMYRERESRLYYHLGNLYFEMNDYARAFQHFKQVIELKPQDFSDAYYLAGRSAHSMGDDTSAVDYFRKYLQLNGSSQEAEWIRANIPNLSQK